MTVLKKQKKRRKRRKHAQKHRMYNRQRPIRFTRYAWAKLKYLRDVGQTEIGGFGVSSPDDLLLVEDVVLPKQECDWANVQFDDDSVADLYDQQVDLGRSPEQFGRIWIHTHPGDSAAPSGTDFDTFDRVFGGAEWAVMFILARGGAATARLQFNVGPRGHIELPMGIEEKADYPKVDPTAWLAEYQRCVTLPVILELDELPHDEWDLYDAWYWNLNTEMEEVALEQLRY